MGKKIARTVGLLSKLRHYMNDKTLIMIYYSLIYPFLIYAIPIWGNACDTFISPIHKLQKKAVRLITFNDSPLIKPHSAPLFKALKILTIHDIFKIETLKFVYDCLNKLNPNQFHDYYCYPTSTHNTANNREVNLNTPQVRTTTYGLRSLKFSGVILWNNVPSHIRDKRRNLFAKALKDFFVASYASE